ncbi:MAG: tRNA pseudouridine(55) synthase TruB, partial [Deltaproteobacteria bacterium]
VRAVKRHLRGCKVGHTGTLDPMATGLLLVLVGQATKLARFLGQGRKRYVARLQLGVETDTWDADGTPTVSRPVPLLEPEQCRKVLAEFVGEVEQVPPAFSALRVGGERMYAKARRGEKVRPRPRRVKIESIRLRSAGEDWLEIEVVCGPGTYIRSLAVDVARRLGTVGHLSALRRLETGGFGLDRALDPEGLSRQSIEKNLIKLPELVGRFSPIALSDRHIRLLANGAALPRRVLDGVLPDGFAGSGTFCFHDAGWSVAVMAECAIGGNGVWKMRILRVLKNVDEKASLV